MRRRAAVFLVVGAVSPLAFAANASAQGAVLKLSTSTAAPGQTITASGRGFSNAAGVSGVTIRLSTRAGRALSSAVTPDTAGKIDVTFPIPANVSPGWYLVLGTQTRANGTAQSFTPGRTTLRVQGAAGQAAAAASRGGGSDGPGPVAVLAAAMSALLVLAAGAALTARRLWTLNRPRVGV